jgi:hypothetical protein
MNPSWLNGKMPEPMYRHEHPDHIEQAKRETEASLRAELKRFSAGEDGEETDPDT